jgi:cold shock protein
MVEQGVVKWFNDAKGYGFISRENGPDVFVHHASIIAEGFRTLQEGDLVSFEAVPGPKGLQAKNVVKISSSSASDVS